MLESRKLNLKLGNLTWFINFHASDEEWVHAEYMNRVGSLAREPPEAVRQPRPISRAGISLTKSDFILSDEFGYVFNITDNDGMYFMYTTELVKEAERPYTTKQMLMQVFQAGR